MGPLGLPGTCSVIGYLLSLPDLSDLSDRPISPFSATDITIHLPPFKHEAVIMLGLTDNQ